MKHLIIALMMLSGPPAHAADWEESPILAELFKSAGVNGTFVLYDLSGQNVTGYDQVRAETGFSPASTFKIPNTLIGLSVGAVGAVGSVDEVLPYGGKPQPFDTWEKDMGLREAIALSNVPIYQELARRIGLEHMIAYVSKLDYGNKELGTTVDTFWLKGPLKISAVEQVDFLARLAQGTLPLSQDVQASVREIVLMEQGDGCHLYGKTGWENAPGPGVGWWVGWVEQDNRLYAFALNMDMQQASDAGKRLELGKASLKALGVLCENL